MRKRPMWRKRQRNYVHTPDRLSRWLRRHDQDARDDEQAAWLELREAGVIDPEAPWPFGVTIGGPS